MFKMVLFVTFGKIPVFPVFLRTEHSAKIGFVEFRPLWDCVSMVRFVFTFKIILILVLVGTYPSIFPVARTLVPYSP